MFSICCKSFLLVIALFAVALTDINTTDTTKSGKGNFEGIPVEDALPPVRYTLHRFTLPADCLAGVWSVWDMNEEGELVGYYDDGFVTGGKQPFYLDTRTDDTIAMNLNDLQFDKEFGVPAGWYIQKALAINNLGDIAGCLVRYDDFEQSRGCVIELHPDPLDLSVKPRIHLIPDSTWSQTYVRRINDAGVVLGQGDSETAYVYRVPLHAHTGDEAVTVIPTSFDVWEQGFLTNPVDGSPTLVKVSLPTSKILTYNVDTDKSNLVDVSDLDISEIRDFNDTGSYCGRYDASKTDDISCYRDFVFDGEFHDLDEGISFHQTLNNHGDLLCETLNHCRPVLYHQTQGLILLDVRLLPETVRNKPSGTTAVGITLQP